MQARTLVHHLRIDSAVYERVHTAYKSVQGGVVGVGGLLCKCGFKLPASVRTRRCCTFIVWRIHLDTGRVVLWPFIGNDFL